jgi:hypothetical protein
MNRRNFFLKILALGSASLLVSRKTSAQEEAANSVALEKWNALSPEEQAKIQERWKQFKSLPLERRQQLLASYRRFRALSPETQRRIRNNLERWRSLNPSQRIFLQRRFTAFSRMSPQRQIVIKERLQKWKALSPDQKKHMKARMMQRRMHRRNRHK